VAEKAGVGVVSSDSVPGTGSAARFRDLLAQLKTLNLFSKMWRLFRRREVAPVAGNTRAYHHKSAFRRFCRSRS
jgi:hypothetical protein